MTETTSSTAAGRPEGDGPRSFSGTAGRMVVVLVLAGTVLGGAYFLSNVQPEEGADGGATEVPAGAGEPMAEGADSASSSGAPVDSVVTPEELPGFETAHLTDKQRLWLYHRAHLEQCDCGCGMNIAQCRVEDPTCPVSPGRAVELIAEAETQDP